MGATICSAKSSQSGLISLFLQILNSEQQKRQIEEGGGGGERRREEEEEERIMAEV